MADYIWILNDKGERERVATAELDDEIYPKLWRPVGGFCFKAEDFKRVSLTTTPFYIQDWLPKQGKAMFYASSKSGKSFLSIQMARCIGAGLPFLGMGTERGRVLYVQFELGAQVLQQRMINTGRNYDNVFVGTSFSMKLDTKAGQDYLLKALEAIEPDVLILDPFYKIISGDESDSQDVGVILDFIDNNIIDMFGCSVVIIHHSGKDKSKGSRGSSVLGDWVDSAIEVKRTSKDESELRIKLTPKLLRHAELSPESKYAILDGFEFVEGGETQTIKDKVEIFMRESDVPVGVKDLVDGDIGSRKSIYNALEDLMKEKKVEKLDRGVYVWIN